MTSHTVYFSWIMLLVTVLVWVVFGFFVWQVGVEQERYATARAEGKLREEQEKTGGQLHTLVRETEGERHALEALVQSDVVAAASAIEAAGAASGATVVVEGATSEQVGEGIRAITVVANLEGTFQSLMRAVTLFESLPFPSKVESLDIESSSGDTRSAKSLWRMSAKIRFITTSTIGV